MNIANLDELNQIVLAKIIIYGITVNQITRLSDLEKLIQACETNSGETILLRDDENKVASYDSNEVALIDQFDVW